MTKSYFIVNPQWISERLEAPPTAERGHRPWPFEYPGARTATRSGRQTVQKEGEEEEEEKLKVELMTSSSVYPVWGNLNTTPRKLVSPVRYSYQLDSSRYESHATPRQSSR